MDWFLYDRDLRHERPNDIRTKSLTSFWVLLFSLNIFLPAGGMWFIEIFCVKQVKVQFILFISERDKMLQLPKTACETHSRISRDIQSKKFHFFSDICIYIFGWETGERIS